MVAIFACSREQFNPFEHRGGVGDTLADAMDFFKDQNEELSLVNIAEFE